ncbi:hydroxyphenylacetyl-CoA thioesterase PaaI [Nonomuraea sp. NPDC049152]|uniref:hydroxyphenylacetyl-CoA thioesterase PaaI n=1 Tax=Nonomuraea sp. NPDC049152 TaxID=3154350 RepID=UPI00340B8890
MMAADVASAVLGIELVSLAPGQAVCKMAVTERMINGHALCHGGYVFLLADTTFACACNTHGPVTVAAGAEISFVSAARAGETLTATALERTLFGRNGIYDITVRGEDGRVVAEFRGRSRALKEEGS